MALERLDGMERHTCGSDNKQVFAIFHWKHAKNDLMLESLHRTRSIFDNR
jgi:hypothetical protein